MKMNVTILDIPIDILAYIFLEYLSTVDIILTKQVCKKFHLVTNHFNDKITKVPYHDLLIRRDLTTPSPQQTCYILGLCLKYVKDFNIHNMCFTITGEAVAQSNLKYNALVLNTSAVSVKSFYTEEKKETESGIVNTEFIYNKEEQEKTLNNIKKSIL